MTCREFVDFIMAYLDSELDPSVRETFDTHLAECPPCIAYLDSYQDTIRLGKLCEAPEGPVPEDVPEGLVRAILAARRS